MSGTLTAKMVRVDFERGETGRIYATSLDIRGLMIGRRTMEELEDALPGAIADLFLACGVRVVVSRLSADDAQESNAWIAFPAEMARSGLERIRASA